MYCYLIMAQNMKEISIGIMDLVLFCGRIKVSTKDSGVTTKWTVRVLSTFKMGSAIKDII